MAYNRKQRLNDNIKAIETAFILDREQRTPTARERLLLERYCGFGGLKCILNPARELADAVHWAKSDLELFAPTVELHRLIRENSKNESEYKQLMDSLKQSVLTAFYTPSAVTEALTDVLKEHQIIPEKVLEPSAGIGAFVDSVLDNNPKADIMAFEKDLLTGKILRHLYPEQKVRIEGFEKIEKPFNDYFDLAISNIPFGDVAVFDPSYTAMKGMRALVTRRIHNYFFVKALDTVRDGGLVAFITSQGVLNAKNNSAARFMMLYHADLVSAIRLPNNLFTENANTEVGSDLIILQKNTQKESLRGDDNLLDTVYNDENRIPTNNYFLEHPERIIHTTAKLDTDPFGKPAMIYTHEDGVEGIAEDLRKMLHEDFKKNLNLNRYLGIEETKAEEVKEVEEIEKIEKTEKMKPSIEEKQNDTVVSLQKQEKPTDDAELSQKSNHQQPPVQMTLFDLWGMEEENRLTVHATKKKAEVTVGAVAKKVSRKKASPLVKSVNPTFEVVTKPVEKEEKPSLRDAKEQETAQETKPILPGDEPYANISWEEFIDNQRAEGNIYELLDAAMAFFFKHLSLSGKINGLYREEELSIPYKALRESCINSFCHRSYHHPGSSVSIAIYDDRVEIRNTGTFPADLPIERLMEEHDSKPQNPIIANVLYKSKILESWGRGISTMVGECKRVGLPAPEINTDGNFVWVVFKYNRSSVVVTPQLPHSYPTATPQLKKVISVIGTATLSAKEIMEIMSLKDKTHFLDKYLYPAIEQESVKWSYQSFII